MCLSDISVVTLEYYLLFVISLLASSSENAKTLPRVSPCWKFVSTFVYLIQFGIIISYIFLWIKFSIMFHVLPGDLHKVGNFAVTQNENICKEMWKSNWIRGTDVGGSCCLQINVMIIRASPHIWAFLWVKPKTTTKMCC